MTPMCTLIQNINAGFDVSEMPCLVENEEARKKQQQEANHEDAQQAHHFQSSPPIMGTEENDSDDDEYENKYGSEDGALAAKKAAPKVAEEDGPGDDEGGNENKSGDEAPTVKSAAPGVHKAGVFGLPLSMGVVTFRGVQKIRRDRFLPCRHRPRNRQITWLRVRVLCERRRQDQGHC